MSVETLVFLSFGFYLAGFLLMFGLRSSILQYFSGWVSIAINLIGLMFSIALFFSIEYSETYDYPWIKVGNLVIELNLLLNKQTTFMFFIVQFISLIVQVFSVQYFKEQFITRFLSFINLFIFSMLGIVVSGNLFMVFIFWELVGLSSYLLIGFYFNKPSANRAAIKAFLMNKIGDAGFMLGILMILVIFKTLNISELHDIIGAYKYDFSSIKVFAGIHGNTLLTITGLLFCCGAIAKSSQFPFQTWLIDAMEGPTPSSALIHAATMVVAGVFLFARMQFLFTEDVRLVICIVGLITAFLAALSALVQFDIKKVLAYSTLSQIGFMFVGIGINAPGASLFHLATHAFFKAGLFLSAGAIIDFMHHEQDMRKMGGLRYKMPIVFICYSIFAASLAGLPFFSGFLSKDSLIVSSIEWSLNKQGGIYFLVPTFLIVTALLTAYYIMRQLVLVFLNRKEQLFAEIWNRVIVTFKGLLKAIKDLVNAENQDLGEENVILFFNKIGPYEFSVIVLALCSFGFFFSDSPFNFEESWFFENFNIPKSNFHWIGWLVFLGSLFSIILAYFFTKSEIGSFKTNTQLSSFKNLLASNYFLDKLYFKIFVVPLVGKLPNDVESDQAHIQDTKSLSVFISKFDSYVIDGFVNFLSKLTIYFSMMIVFIDDNFVDGIVKVIYKIVYFSGNYIRRIQGGQIQLYLISLMLLLSLVVFIQYIINSL
jgi:NADH-quinone oxidoreductase subunit L